MHKHRTAFAINASLVVVVTLAANTLLAQQENTGGP
jgi:hypothetical protein